MSTVTREQGRTSIGPVTGAISLSPSREPVGFKATPKHEDSVPAGKMRIQGPFGGLPLKLLEIHIRTHHHPPQQYAWLILALAVVVLAVFLHSQVPSCGHQVGISVL